MQTTKRSVAALVGVVAALAIAGPIAGANATPISEPAFAGMPPSSVGLTAGSGPTAIGPTIIGAVFNGVTVVQVVNGPSVASVSG